jgi:DNA-binding NarL/FixJ family response regulator
MLLCLDSAARLVTLEFRLDGDYLPTSPVRVFVVDDYEPFRRRVVSMLQEQPELQIICEASDGSEAVQKAEELQPDLILLDIGLPKLNGIEVARRIRHLSPGSKILFVSQESSADLVREALATGARGYVVKTDAGRELLPAVEAVLRGKQFVGRRFASQDFTEISDAEASEGPRSKSMFAPVQRSVEIARRHEAGFHSDDASLLDDITQFIGTALRAGNATIVLATEPHRNSLLPRLQSYGSDTAAAIEQGRYISLDAADTLSTFMVNGMPDPVRFLRLLGNLIGTAAETAKREQARVAFFGECVHLLWAQGNAEAAIQVEKLINQLPQTYDVDTLCGYSLSSLQGGMESHIFQRICAEHSAVHSR